MNRLHIKEADIKTLKRLQQKKRAGQWDGSAEKYLQWLNKHINKYKQTA